MQHCGVQSECIYQVTPAPKIQGTLQMRELKDPKSQMREFAVRMWFVVTSEATILRFQQHACLIMS